LLIEGHGADCALFVAAMMSGGVFILAAAEIGLPFCFADEFFGFAERKANIFGEAFRAVSDSASCADIAREFSREANGILQAMQTRLRRRREGWLRP